MILGMNDIQETSKTNDILKCKCGGGYPQIKYFGTFSWITCKKCCKTTQVYNDTFRKQDGLEKAITEWNKLNEETKNV